MKSRQNATTLDDRLVKAADLQTAAVLQWVFCFLFGAQCCFCVYVVIVLNGYWHVAALYALWLYLDWDTPQAGGRRSDWVRHWTVWKHFGDYFPIHLIKTCDLDPERNYLMGFHPHGILVAGAFGNFCTEYTGFQELYPGMTPYLHTLSIWFGFPFFREYLMSSVIGGTAESLEARPGSLILEALNRKGFVKIALRCGAHLVPVFSFGENDLFNQLKNPKGSLVRTIQEGMRKTLGFSLPLFHTRGVFQYSSGFMPYRQPIYTIVGEPIVVERNVSPSSAEADRLHGCYLEALAKLFEQHKAEYRILEHQHLIFT
uniref:2-acylglycerol O-acyltransferase 1-like n=1 Tax=Oncorhynchus gorbuscha TaxID=8017 RepID=UPI001EAF290C|nr:2-acylglycerol O-acyltransferase 1-like [Oncorhynchus gorbuscha]